MTEAYQPLDALLEQYTEVNPKGFTVDLETRTDEWDRAIKAVGVRKAYDHIAAWLCGRYAERFGEEFLFSEACVCYEIEYHTDAYMCATGHRGYHRNVTSFLFSRESLKRHCRQIDISTDDVHDWKQRTQFGYKKGIRAKYRNTDKDPFYQAQKRPGRE